MLPQSLQKAAEEKWKEYRASAENAGVEAVLDSRSAELLQYVFAFSDFALRLCLRHPEIPQDLIRTGDLYRTYKSEEYAARIAKFFEGVAEECDLMRILRVIRQREMLRIACRDLAGLADLWETMRDLSGFADACVEGALSVLYQWQCAQYGIPFGNSGTPQQMVVLGMGKLGAGELNFSSDIDLIFAYPEIGETRNSPKSISNTDFFLRLGRSLIRVLGNPTADGIVFRVDMNLRPFGEGGPLAMSFDAMESYYHEQGREWERYAWIKARVIAGDRDAGARLLKELNTFVFRRYVDYGVFESLREMKQKISREVLRKGMKDNIKLGAGGIREVEFFGQVFQLIRGGLKPVLQERCIAAVLKLLVQEKHIPRSVCDALTRAYEFLRHTEHRLQEFGDAQTHTLPGDAAGKERLALALGFQNAESFRKTLDHHRNTVHLHFRSLLKLGNAENPADTCPRICTEIWQNPAKAGENPDMLKTAGFDDPRSILHLLADFREDLAAQALSSEGRERIDRFIPLVLAQIRNKDRAAVILDRILRLVRAIRRRTSYISLLLENPDTLDHLSRLADSSAWILSFLSSHPLLLDELMDSRTLYLAPSREELESDLAQRLSRTDPDDLEQQMDALRIFRQVNVLRVAAADISDAMPLMRVSDHLSDIAETVLGHVLELSWNHLVRRHGRPECGHGVQCTDRDRGFAVIAYGKLGGLELGYGSDLDLVFLHSGTGGETQGGKNPIDTITFFARLGQRVLHLLSTHTGTGRLYEADMRLRPSGASGILVSSVEGFRTYQREEAWTWEKQALVRARPIAGDPGLMIRFNEIRKEILAQPREENMLRKEIREMRERMKKELLKAEPGVFDLKQGDGGIVDIEFLVQFLVLNNAHEHPEILTWTDNVRLIRTLWDVGILDETTAYFLRKAYLTFRAAGHKRSLREMPAEVTEDHFRDLREQVVRIWDKFMNVA